MNIALDEWGIWASDVNVADLEARRRHRRLFGGYAFGVQTSLHQGGLGDRQVKIPCTGYGIVLDRTYITSRLATAATATAREVMADTFELAGVTDEDFTLGGVEIDDVVGRGNYPVGTSVSDVGRSVAEVTGGVPWVDPVRELQLVRRTQVEHSPIVLDGTNVQSAGNQREAAALRLEGHPDWCAAVGHVGGQLHRRRGDHRVRDAVSAGAGAGDQGGRRGRDLRRHQPYMDL